MQNIESPHGRIVSLSRTARPAHALVEIDAVAACPRCKEGKGCGAGLAGSNAASRRVDAVIDTGVEVREGDEVRIELAPQHLLRAAMIVYGLPLLGAVSGAAVAYLAGLSDLHASIAALGGIVLGLAAARMRLRAAQCLRQFTPTIVERMPSDQGQPAGR